MIDTHDHYIDPTFLSSEMPFYELLKKESELIENSVTELTMHLLRYEFFSYNGRSRSAEIFYRLFPILNLNSNQSTSLEEEAKEAFGNFYITFESLIRNSIVSHVSGLMRLAIRSLEDGLLPVYPYKKISKKNKGKYNER